MPGKSDDGPQKKRQGLKDGRPVTDPTGEEHQRQAEEFAEVICRLRGVKPAEVPLAYKHLIAAFEAMTGKGVAEADAPDSPPTFNFPYTEKGDN